MVWGACPLGQCFERGCVESKPGVECAECVSEVGSGWLNGTECVYETFVVPKLRSVDPGWPCGLGKCVERGKCVSSKVGTRCDACKNRGYVVISNRDYGPTCVCYDARHDGRAGCASLFDEKRETLNITDAYERIECVSHQNELMGFYKPTSHSTKYGDENPAVPISCVEPLGPPPGQLVENKPPYDTCNTIGGADPDQLYSSRQDASFKTCSYHGLWNRTTRACECDAKWALVDVGGVDPANGKPAQTCGTCSGDWGPLPKEFDPGQPQSPPYCVAPYFENERGVRLPCSGHGVFKFDICICHSSYTLGFWDVIEIRGIRTCAVCKRGFGPPGKCNVLLSTESPTVDPPTLEPTQAPTRNSSCTPCFEKDMGRVSLDYDPDIVGSLPANFTSACCTHEPMTVLDNRAVRFPLNGTCFESEDARTSLGFELCDWVEACTAFTWTLGDGYVDYAVLNGTGFGVIPNESAGSAAACTRTQSPTKFPTPERTAYPTTSRRILDDDHF